MRKIATRFAMSVFFTFCFIPISIADETVTDQEMVHCCRFDCAPMFCQRWPKACYYIDREHCEHWIGHGHARIVRGCKDCEFAKRNP